MRATYRFEDSPFVTDNFHLVVKGLTDEALEAAAEKLIRGAKTSNNFAPRLAPGDVADQAEALIPSEHKGLNPAKWIWGKDEQMRQLAWHPDQRTPDGKIYPPLTAEQIKRAHPKMEPAGRDGSLAIMRELANKWDAKKVKGYPSAAEIKNAKLFVGAKE